jgi:hypothetical protein
MTTTTQPVEARGLATGERLLLRAVAEGDLAALAELISANPGQRSPKLWTAQLLKKKFESENDPGLWCEREKYYVAVDKATGAVVGYLRQVTDVPAGDMCIVLHVAGDAADRDALGRELLRLYVDLTAQWTPRHRIGAEIIDVETDKAEWLESTGFVHELTRARCFLYLGQAAGVSHWAWFRGEQN